MTALLEGKVAIVTGASSGIGRATALAAAAAGASVVAAARREPELKSLVEEIASRGGEAIAITTDVTREEQVEKLVDGCIGRFGRLDCAFNNAGIEGPSRALHEYDRDEFRQVLDVNIGGTFLCMKYEIAYMVKNSGGAIVNEASVAGIRAMYRQSAYTASKHAIIGMTRAAAQEYGRNGIRINAVCPGFTETDMVRRLTRNDPDRAARLAALSPMNRMATVDEIARAVVWLCSGESSFVNGEALVLDGGLSI